MMATATALTTMSALSFQIMATHNHPATPIPCRIIFIGYRLFVVAIIAKTSTIELPHFTYQLKGWWCFKGVEVFVLCSCSFSSMFPLHLSESITYLKRVCQAKNSSLDTYCIYRLSFPPSLKAQKRGGVYTIREPTPHLGAPAATQFVLPHSVPIVAVWYLRFPSTASSQRLMCGLLRLHSRH